MKTIQIRARIVPNPRPTFVGSLITLEIPEDALEWRIHNLHVASDCMRASVDWGDGSAETTAGGSYLSHTYARPGTYEVRLSDEIDVLSVCRKAPTYWRGYSLRIIGFHSNACRLTSIPDYGFRDCVNMRTLDVSEASVISVGEEAFYACGRLQGRLDFPNVRELNPSATAGSGIFCGCQAIREIHFAAAHEQEIRATTSYRSDPTLGSGTARCVFDL